MPNMFNPQADRVAARRRPNAPRMRNRRHFFWLFFPLIFAALAGLVMLLWNAILPAVTPARPLTYWQAAGLLLLCRILFSGPGKFFSRSPRRFKNPWKTMSPEDRMKFKEEWRKRRSKGFKD